MNAQEASARAIQTVLHVMILLVATLVLVNLVIRLNNSFDVNKRNQLIFMFSLLMGHVKISTNALIQAVVSIILTHTVPIYKARMNADVLLIIQLEV